MKTSHIEVAVPVVMIPLPPSTAGVRDQWEDILPPPSPQRGYGFGTGAGSSYIESYDTGCNGPLETHLEQFPTHFEQLSL